MQKILRNLTLGVAVAGMALLLFCFPRAVLTGASRGLSLCGEVLIPSLLPFLTLVGICMHSGLKNALAALFCRPVAILFRLPCSAAAPLLFSFIGGYPAGAVAVKTLLEQQTIDQKSAMRMMHFCVGAGPAFAVSAVGGVMLGNMSGGWLLLAAHILSALIIGCVEARFALMPLKTEHISRPLPLSAAFTVSVANATEALLSMSGFVILFSVVLSLADGVGVTSFIDTYVSGGTMMLAGVLEVTSGCMAAANGATPAIFLIGFFLSFGGMSVHCQIRSVLRAYPAVLKDFFLFRLVHGLLGGVMSVLLLWAFPSAVSVLAPDSATVKMHTVSPLVSLVLLLMCATLLISGKKRLPKTEECDMV